jgi:hypothetical protein
MDDYQTGRPRECDESRESETDTATPPTETVDAPDEPRGCVGSRESRGSVFMADNANQDGDAADSDTPPSVVLPPSDYPSPPAVSGLRRVVYWDDEDDAIDNYRTLGDALAGSGDVYRSPPYASGLTVASADSRVPVVTVKAGKRLAAVITDRVRVRVRKEGKDKGSRIPNGHLEGMLLTEAFLQRFRPVDSVTKTPYYLPDFTLAARGYHDGGPGHRVIYAGPEPVVADGLDATNAFIDIMPWATRADRTNAVAARLTVMLRRFWPGGKPIILATATKSQAGKDTVLAFAAGTTTRKSISYQQTDWPLEQAIVSVLSRNPDVGLMVVENARLGRGERYIASTCLERMATDPELCLHSTKESGTYQRPNDLVLGISTNFGAVSEDLANRSLPSHLDPTGDIHSRESPIGDPRRHYLPRYAEQIQAEMRGMVARWVAAGRPLDTSVRHPMPEWAQTVGGILQVSGFRDFLANYATRKVSDDPLRRALGILGAVRPDQWLRSDEWARLALQVGVAKAVIPDGDRDSDAGMRRGIGVVFSVHADETYSVETEDERLRLRLQKGRRRWTPGGETETRYRFEVLARAEIPADDDGRDAAA